MKSSSDIRILLDEREKAIDALGILHDEMAKLRLSGHQDDVSLGVSIGGRSRRIAIATVTRESGYASAQVRGMEMLMLGIKKWYAGEIDVAKERIKNIENKLREATK